MQSAYCSPVDLCGHRRRLLHTPTHQDALARTIVSALLSAQAGYTPGVSVKVVKGIWKEYLTRSYFEPVAGAQ